MFKFNKRSHIPLIPKGRDLFFRYENGLESNNANEASLTKLFLRAVEIHSKKVNQFSRVFPSKMSEKPEYRQEKSDNEALTNTENDPELEPEVESHEKNVSHSSFEWSAII